MRRHHGQTAWLLIAGVLAVATVVAGCGGPMGGTNSGATAFLRVSALPDSLLGEKRAYAEQEYAVYKATQAAMLTNPVVLTAALRDPDVASLPMVKAQRTDSIRWLRSALRVSFPGDSEIMEVAFVGDDSPDAAKLVNAVVKAYLSEVVDVERSAKHRELADLTTVLANKEEKIRQLRTAMKQTADELGTVDAETWRTQIQPALQELALSREQLSQVQRELRQAKIDRTVLQARLDRATKRDATEPSAGAATSKQPLGNAAIVELQERIADADIRAQLLENEAAALQKTMQNMKAEFEHIIGRSSVQLDMMHKDLENLEAVWKDIAARRENLEIEANSPPRVRLLQSAMAGPSAGPAPAQTK